MSLVHVYLDSNVGVRGNEAYYLQNISKRDPLKCAFPFHLYFPTVFLGSCV